MARSLSHTLVLTRFSYTTPTRLASLRHRSNLPEIISGETPAKEEVERVAMKNLEDAIHKIIVKRSQPDWIPFVPGASYWVPPRSKAQGLAKVIGNLVHGSAAASSTSDAVMLKGGGYKKRLSVSSNRGWPSNAHFFKGASHSPEDGETTSKHTSKTEDEEG